MEISPSSSSSFVSKARTAFHSAAAKAERVFSDLRDSDKQSPKDLGKLSEDESTSTGGESKQFKWRPAPIGTKQDWQDRLRSIGIGKDNSSAPSYEENQHIFNSKNDIETKAVEAIPSVEALSAANNGLIPPHSAIKQLALAAEDGKKYKSMKDFLASSGGSSPGREKGLSLSAVKSLMLRDKDNKLINEFGSNEKVLALIRTLFDKDTKFPMLMTSSGSEAAAIISFARDIHGSPPDSLVVKVAEVIGSFKNIRKAALFWRRVVAELKRLWSVEQFIPGIPPDSIPDLNSCLLYQQLQVINCCISRKRRRDIASQSLDIVLKDSSLNAEESAAVNDDIVANSVLYAKTNSGELIVRLGADRPFSDLTMLETGEPVYSPVTQEGPLLTEDLIKENEEFVLRTGSVGAGCSQLLSDMQAFKAANPGCILEDFVRWHSPPDWTEAEHIDMDNKNPFDDDDLMSTRGQLSSRMQKEGNLWREFWETSKPIPAVRQTPLFDEDLAVEGILETLEDMPPTELFQQLFISLLGLGFVVVEASLPSNTDLIKLFYECKDYASTTCQSESWFEKIDDLCEVYETVEGILRNPEEVLKCVNQADESGNNTGGETRKLFKRLNLNFGSKDRHFRRTPPPKVQKKSTDEKDRNGQPFSTFFEGKSSLFSKISPSPKPAKTPQPVKSALLENDWTMV